MRMMGLKKIAFIYPAGNTQYEGMGKEIAANYQKANAVFEVANETLGIDLKKLCFEGPEVQLMKITVGQPAVIATSLAIHEALIGEGIVPDMVAGFSLGEYTALTAAGCISAGQMMNLLANRIRHMQKVIQDKRCSVRLIIGLDKERVKMATQQASDEGTVAIANHNAPGQIVIAGEAAAVKKACQLCKEYGAQRIGLIASAIPSHTRLMEGAAGDLTEELSRITIHPPRYPIVSNTTAREMRQEDIAALIVQHLSKPVLWEESIQYMISQGVDTFIEVGPGTTLTKHVQQINSEVLALHVEDMTTLQQTMDAMKRR